MDIARPTWRRLSSAVSAYADRAVVRQLGGVLVEQPPVLDVSPADPQAFWDASEVARPRRVWVERRWNAFQGPGWRELELAGDSAGPGTHPGSRRLYATAHVGPRRDAAPLVVLVHGYAIPFTGFDRFIAWRMRRQGAHTVRLELPFHLRRAAPGQHSGDHFFSVDPAHIRAVVRQSVEDTAAVVAWARREVTADVRVLGTSLGGLMALLLAALTPVQRTLVIAPLCDPPATFTQTRKGAMHEYMGMLGEAAGFWGRDRESARDVLEDALAPITPRRLRPVTPPDRITIVEACDDRVVGTEPMEELVQAWGTPAWRYPHGHITVMNAHGLPARVVSHLTSPQGEGGADRLALAG